MAVRPCSHVCVLDAYGCTCRGTLIYAGICGGFVISSTVPYFFLHLILKQDLLFDQELIISHSLTDMPTFNVSTKDPDSGAHASTASSQSKFISLVQIYMLRLHNDLLILL